MNLNPEQTRAVEHGGGPLLILAGAGSGKTRVLTERVVRLVEKCLASPFEILAVTFTNKAAGEMRSRIESRIGPRARDIWMSTFHSVCVRILRRHAEAVGLPQTFTIFDEADQRAVVKSVMEELNISEKLISPRSAVDKISRAKDALVMPDDYPDGDFYNAKVAKIYRAYQNQLHKEGAVDFGDLLVLTVRLFAGRQEILKHYQERFKHILVDEYQDTNHAQYELIRMLSDLHKNICVVGDPDQSIYAWRGADIGNILEFERDFPGATVIRLEQNYRSTKNILLASDEVIANNTSRKEKTLWTENEEGEPIYLVETTDERGEAVSVVKEMKKLRQRGVRLSEMAIFYRTNAQSRIFEDELRKESIPYIIYGGVKFYDRQEIKNVIAYLNLANNPADNTSLKRIINVPARGIGKTTVEKLEAEAINAGVGMLEYIRRGAFGDNFNAGTRSRLTSFLKLINELAGMKDQRLPDFVSEAIKKTLYIEALTAEKTEEALERIANIDELISAVAEAFRQTPELTLSEFLDQVALVSDIDRYDDAEDVLPMMTMHLAKGLEFATVFIVGLEEGLLPHIRSIDEPSEIEEERRLFYVGMTRAKKTLYICHARERMVRGSYTYNVPSRFLEEVPGKLVQRLNEAPKRPEFNIFRPRRQESAGASSFDSEFCQIQSGNFAEFADESAGPMYKVGQRVRHPTFGEGIIRRTEGKPGQQKLLVQFKSGDLKNLSANHANLAML